MLISSIYFLSFSWQSQILSSEQIETESMINLCNFPFHHYVWLILLSFFYFASHSKSEIDNKKIGGTTHDLIHFDLSWVGFGLACCMFSLWSLNVFWCQTPPFFEYLYQSDRFVCVWRSTTKNFECIFALAVYGHHRTFYVSIPTT